MLPLCISMSSPQSDDQWSADAHDILPDLSAEQLTLLSSIRMARVTIDSLTVPTDITLKKATIKGQPRQPIANNKW